MLVSQPVAVEVVVLVRHAVAVFVAREGVEAVCQLEPVAEHVVVAAERPQVRGPRELGAVGEPIAVGVPRLGTRLHAGRGQRRPNPAREADPVEVGRAGNDGGVVVAGRVAGQDGIRGCLSFWGFWGFAQSNPPARDATTTTERSSALRWAEA